MNLRMSGRRTLDEVQKIDGSIDAVQKEFDKQAAGKKAVQALEIPKASCVKPYVTRTATPNPCTMM